jgi:RNA 3'-terminal phosphate cyclase (ATP)
MITIDGSLGEGGGQVLRSSLALSLLTRQSFRMIHVRARRSKPGLQPQHLMSVKAAAAIGNAKVKGAELHSQGLTFEPGEVQAGDYRFPIGTAGATGLILHTVYLPLAMTGKESRVVVEGGTHVPNSPCYHFLEATWRRYLAEIGVRIDLHMDRPGFYPRGGGKIEAVIHGATRDQLKALHLESCAGSRLVRGFSAVAGLPSGIAKRQAEQARQRLEAENCEVDIELLTWQGGPGTVVGLSVATPIPTFFFALGARGKRAEAVADEAVDQVLAFLAGPLGVDAHSADQLLLPLAFAQAASSFPAAQLTQHLFTNRETLAAFLPRKIEIEGQQNEPGRVEIGGE